MCLAFHRLWWQEVHTMYPVEMPHPLVDKEITKMSSTQEMTTINVFF